MSCRSVSAIHSYVAAVDHESSAEMISGAFQFGVLTRAAAERTIYSP